MTADNKQQRQAKVLQEIRKMDGGDRMEKIIIYGSQYGTTKRYAEELAGQTGIQAMSYEQVKDLSAYDMVVYLGGLYAGGVTGLPKTVKLLNSRQKLLIVTVGLADPGDPANADHIKESLGRQIPKVLYERAEIFHIRGGIDYQKLNLKHRVMMKFMYSQLKKLPPEKQTAEVKAMIDTYGQKVEFVNLGSLKEIIKAVKGE